MVEADRPVGPCRVVARKLGRRLPHSVVDLGSRVAAEVNWPLECGVVDVNGDDLTPLKVDMDPQGHAELDSHQLFVHAPIFARGDRSAWRRDGPAGSPPGTCKGVSGELGWFPGAP